MAPIWEGVLLGITLATLFGFGPALFALIQTSIHRGLWSGFTLAFGIFLSDLALVGLCFLGAIKIMNKPENHFLFGVISGLILIAFGIVTYTRKVKLQDDEEDENNNAPGPLTQIAKGFFLNIANPFVWIFWMGVVVGITANYQGDGNKVILFFSGTLLTVLGVDMLKCFGAYKIKRYLTANFIRWINRIAGIGLSLFGIFLIIKTFIGA
ncbi:MAG: LysE family transporter [Bacteroidales bacterium]